MDWSDPPSAVVADHALLQIVEVTNDLLRAGLDETEAAIDRALARVGQLVEVDRATVIRLRGTDRMDNTHEWVAPGVPRMRAQSQDMPIDLLDPWREVMDRGEAVAVVDTAALQEGLPAREILEAQGIRAMLAAPMLSEGKLSGLAAFDVISRPRGFGPLETRLLQTLANAIGVIMDRVAAATRAAEAADLLIERRDRIQAILSALPDLVVEIDGEGRYVSANTAANVAGFVPPDQYIGFRVDEVLPPVILARYRAAVADIDAGSPSASFEYELDPNGKPCVRICRLAPRLLKGRRDGCIAFVRDVTAEREREYRLATLSKVAMLTSNLIIMTDAETRIEWVNPAFEQRTGWNLEEVKGFMPRDLLRGEQADQSSIDKIETAVQAQGSFQTEILNRTRSGEEYWVAMDTQPIHDAAGRVQGFISVQTEITQIKQSHDREVQDWQAAIEAASDGVAVLSPEGGYRYMNRAYRDMFGLDAHIAAKSLHWNDLHPGLAVPLPHAGGPPCSREMRGRHRDGRPVQQEVSVTPREDGCLLVIAREITERTRLEAQRAALREELQLAQQKATIAHVASFVAHDLNNVISVVRGASAALEGRMSDDAPAMVSLDQIRRAADMAGALVAGITQLGKRNPIPASHDLRELVSRGVDLIGQPRIEAHQVTLDMPDRPLPVWAEATRLLQVVVNLVLNACESDPDRPAQVRISASLDNGWQPGSAPRIGFHDPRQHYALLVVEDTGQGVAPERLDDIFQPYCTTKGDIGTGLGLSIVEAILNDSGAALWFDTTPGEGTTVTVAWPVASAGTAAGPRLGYASALDEQDTGQDTGQDGAAGVDPAVLAGRTILVVDDLPDVADILAAQLDRAGAITVAVSDPHEAVELLTTDPGAWSALVTDHTMPGLSGSDLAQIAAALKPPVPSLIVTAQPEKVRVQHSPHLVILSKPVKMADLVRSVRDLVVSAGSI